MIRKLANLFILLPVGILLVVLSVANRQSVSLALNPFRPDDTQLAVQAPFFVFLFAALMLGMVLGSLATWFKQGRHRKQARVQSREAAKWQAEADTHKTRAEELTAQVTSSSAPQLPAR
ncbi:MAG: LapA family protein [Proteobacteria bacterium]|nr:LapA family protein [Pseudomonadota bacterium]